MAMSGRKYTVSFQNVAISAVQDVISLIAGSSKALALHHVNLGQITGVTVSNLRMRLRMLPVTVTNGSGGSAPTPQKTNPSDAAATFTARANDTTQATSSGTAVDLYPDVFNTINGFVWYPPIIGHPPICPISGAFILSLDTAPGSAITCNFAATVEELP